MFDPSIDPLYPILHHMLPSDNTHFHPYSPNEVKHRRRTTTFQLQHLEAVFTVDTKPNATRRNELAAQLGMSSRGVQVCSPPFFVLLSSASFSFPPCLGLVPESVFTCFSLSSLAVHAHPVL